MTKPFAIDNDQTITHINGHVYAGRYDGPLPPEAKRFSYEFLPEDAANMVWHTTDITEAIRTSPSPFFLSLDAETV